MWGSRNQELFTLFAAWMLTCGMAMSTIKRRRVSIGSFTRWAAPMDLVTADRDCIEGWLGTFANKRTRHSYRSDLAAFYSWAVRRRVVEADPMLDVARVRQPKSQPRPVPAEYVPGIIDSAPTPRLRLALQLAAYGGLRVSEISALDADDISLHPSRPTLVVRHGKGDKDRIVPLHPVLVRALAGRRTGRVVPWGPEHLSRLASAHMRSLGHDYTIHQLRGSCATELARVTHGDVVRIARFLGHQDPNTTMGYVGFSEGVDGLEGLYSA